MAAWTSRGTAPPGGSDSVNNGGANGGAGGDAGANGGNDAGVIATPDGNIPVTPFAGHAAGSPAGDAAPRKRGRPKGSGNAGAATKAPSASHSVAGIEQLLLSIHMMAAAAFQAPELKMAEKEAEEISKAVANVARHYPGGMSQQAMDWTNLGMVLFAAYAPRAIMMRARVKHNEAQTKAGNATQANGHLHAVS